MQTCLFPWFVKEELHCEAVWKRRVFVQGSQIWIHAWLYKHHLYSSLSTAESEVSLCLLNRWSESYYCHSGSAAVTLHLSLKLNSKHPHSGSESKWKAWVNWWQRLEQEFNWLLEGKGVCICLLIPWSPQAELHLIVTAKLCYGSELTWLMELDLMLWPLLVLPVTLDWLFSKLHLGLPLSKPMSQCLLHRSFLGIFT